MTNELIEAMRKQFEEWRVATTCDLDGEPLGGRSCAQQWAAWQAALAAAEETTTGG